jgi:septum formation protein
MNEESRKSALNGYTLVLASSSPFRKSVLSRLNLPFEIFTPEIDEKPFVNESPTELVLRLSDEKARTAQATYPKALVIGSDQVAVVGDKILGKSGNHEQAVKQLQLMNGKQVDFITGLCVLNTETELAEVDALVFSVQFRQLTESKIENYLRQDTPYHCSGSFKSEGLGIVLLEKMMGNDPTTVMGLPLIRLVQMLENQGINII